ncbi:MAG: nitroreductase family protein [Peptococcaceae bacterium]|nr:nitroreductase family protein [Peptococcaceae bacterium]
MDFLQLAKQRYSVRKFQTQKVEESKLMHILEAGRVAPTAANMQPQKLIVVQSDAALAKLATATNLYGAPLALIVCADHTKAWKRPFDAKQTVDIDASIVTDHMMLQATELGLGSVWICYFKPDVIRQEFNLPECVEPINILAIGYSEGESASPERHAKLRKPLETIVTFE